MREEKARHHTCYMLEKNLGEDIRSFLRVFSLSTVPKEMSYRVTLEVLEAAGLTTPSTGGQPLSVLGITVQSRPEVSRRTRQLPGKTPVWCERFVFEGCQETDVIKMELTDHSVVDKQSIVGMCEFPIGGPRRQVGSKWVALDGPAALTAKVRVLWEVTESLDWALKVPKDPMASIPVTTHSDPGNPIPAEEKTESSSSLKESPSLLGNQISELRDAFSGRVSSLELRMQCVEELFATRRDFDAKRRQEQLKEAGQSHYGKSTFTPHPWVIASQQSAAAVKEIRYDPKSQSALQSILTSPTAVSAYDDQIVAYQTTSPILLPKPRLIGFVPATAPGGVRT
jgi:hypothetical protein